MNRKELQKQNAKAYQLFTTREEAEANRAASPGHKLWRVSVPGRPDRYTWESDCHWAINNAAKADDYRYCAVVSAEDTKRAVENLCDPNARRLFGTPEEAEQNRPASSGYRLFRVTAPGRPDRFAWRKDQPQRTRILAAEEDGYRAVPADDKNLFHRLHKWAVRQDENFCTEVLALIVQHLLERHPAVGVRLLSLLTKEVLVVPESEAAKVDIRTQAETTEGWADLEIRWTDCLVVIEVKVESGVGKGQLQAYRAFLRESGYARTLLVLLTRDPATLGADGEKPDLFLRWHQVAGWLDRDGAITDPVACFLCEQFLGFLKAGSMTSGEVGEVAGSLAGA
jgi:hypothetical protein